MVLMRAIGMVDSLDDWTVEMRDKKRVCKLVDKMDEYMDVLMEC